MTSIAPGLFAFAVRTGVVQSLSAEQPKVRVSLDDTTVEATLLAHVQPIPRVGDIALIACSLEHESFVVGIVSAQPRVEKLTMRDGHTAMLHGDGTSETLQVRNADGRVIIEVCNGRTMVRAVDGDLELRADEGSIRLEARDTVDLRAGGSASVSQADGAKVTVDGGGASVHGPSFRTETDRVHLEAQSIEMEARSQSLKADRAQWVIGSLETRAGKILERARDVYRDVEGVLQTRATRIRSIARETFAVLSRRTVMRSSDDVRVDGKKIYLG